MLAMQVCNHVCMRIVKKEWNVEQKRFLCLYHPFRRARHSVFDALSLAEASLDCFAPLAVGCGDLDES